MTWVILSLGDCVAVNYSMYCKRWGLELGWNELLKVACVKLDARWRCLGHLAVSLKLPHFFYKCSWIYNICCIYRIYNEPIFHERYLLSINTETVKFVTIYRIHTGLEGPSYAVRSTMLQIHGVLTLNVTKESQSLLFHNWRPLNIIYRTEPFESLFCFNIGRTLQFVCT